MPQHSGQPYKDLALTQLRSFREVCRLGGFAQAGRQLKLTTPAIWEQIRGLERYFQVALLKRERNRVHPTIQGLRLLGLTQPLLAEIESIRDVLQQEENILPEQLSILTNLRVLADEISRAMMLFHQRYPTVRLQVHYAGIEQIQPMVFERPSNVTFTLESRPDESLPRALQYDPAGEVDYLLVTPPDHPLLGQKRLRLESLVAHALVLGNPTTYSRHRIQEVIHRHGLTGEMKIVAETSSDEYTLYCVRAGLGIGIAVGRPESSMFHDLGVRSLRQWFGSARVGFLRRRGAHPPPLEQELEELLRLCVGTIAKKKLADASAQMK